MNFVPPLRPPYYKTSQKKQLGYSRIAYDMCIRFHAFSQQVAKKKHYGNISMGGGMPNHTQQRGFRLPLQIRQSSTVGGMMLL